MFKSTSSNEQHRARNEGPAASRNEHGIDPSAFKAAPPSLDAELERAQDQYRDALARQNKIKQLIGAGLGQKSANGKYVDRKLWSSWQQEKLAIAGELLELNNKISHIKRQIKKNNEEAKKDDTFDACFKEVARELLAGPVYDRLITATIHRLGER